MINSQMPFEVRCPLHGSIPFNERECAIIDHPHYQRLRSISQLGMAHLVYPGATHSRFSHGLGVMMLAGRIFDHIISISEKVLRSHFSEKDLAYCRQIVRFSGLLHDLGHPPFSHSFEPLLPKLGVLSIPGDWYIQFDPERQATHEDYSVALIHDLSGNGSNLLSPEEAHDIASLVHGGIRPGPRLSSLSREPSKNIQPLLKQIISGEIDADRMDYLQRDAHFAGVPYGYFDLDRLIQALGISETPDGLVMALEYNALYTYENFLMTRFHMAMQVYLHKTILLFEHFLRQSIESGEISLGLGEGLEAFTRAREDILMARLYEAREQRWAGRILNRTPFPRLIQLHEQDGPGEKERILRVLEDEGIEAIHIRAERRLSNLGDGSDKEGIPLMVHETILGKTTWKPLHEVSALLKSYNQIFAMENIYCNPDHYQKGVDLLREWYGNKGE